MFEAFFSGLTLIFQWPAFGFLILGILVGIWFGAVPGLGDSGYSVVNLTTEDKQQTREGVVLVRVSNALVSVTYNGSDFETKKAPSTDEINNGAIKAAKAAEQTAHEDLLRARSEQAKDHSPRSATRSDDHDPLPLRLEPLAAQRGDKACVVGVIAFDGSRPILISRNDDRVDRAEPFGIRSDRVEHGNHHLLVRHGHVTTLKAQSDQPTHRLPDLFRPHR